MGKICKRRRYMWFGWELSETWIGFGPVLESLNHIVLVEGSSFEIVGFSKEVLFDRVKQIPRVNYWVWTHIWITEKENNYTIIRFEITIARWQSRVTLWRLKKRCFCQLKEFSS